MHSHSNSVKKHRYFVDYLTKRKQTRRDAHSAASPEENRIESQGSGFDPEKVEGPDGYAVFAALTQTAETEIKPDRNPVKRIRSGKEEQRNEREMTFGAKKKVVASDMKLATTPGAGDGNRTRTLSRTRDFKSRASACSATPAFSKK